MLAASPQILIVDDEMDICRNMSDILCDLGYRVDVAHDGESALGLVKMQQYDVALLDLMMPGMDGTELYIEIRKVCCKTVAMIITAYPGHPRVEAALTAGIWHVLPKPIDLRRLIGYIEVAIDETVEETGM